MIFCSRLLRARPNRKSFPETPLQSRHAGAAHPEQRRGLLQGGMRQGGQKDGLGSTQLFYIGGPSHDSLGLGDKFRVDPTGP